MTLRNILLLTAITLSCFVSISNSQLISISGTEEVVIKEQDSNVTIEVSDSGELTISAIATSDNSHVSAYGRITLPKEPVNSKGISFEVAGDGSDLLGSVFVGYYNNLVDGFEATFYLDDTNWHKVTLDWDDFMLNFPPWRKTKQLKDLMPDTGKITHIGFGRGISFHKYDVGDFRFRIRNIKFEDKATNKKQITNYSHGLEKTHQIAQNGDKLKILLLGDSITDLGGNQSYGYYFGELFKRKYGVDVEICNQGIAGHSVRGGSIVFPRAIKAMNDPDLVCILYGANDCKAIEQGFDSDDFEQQISKLISQVRNATSGKADIVLFTGVPRLTEDRLSSAEQIEPLLDGIKNAAHNNNTALCDTFSEYIKMNPKDRIKLYRDTIHQNDAGQREIGKIFYQIF